MFTDQVGEYNYNMFSPPLSPDPAWELPPIKQGPRQLTLEEWMNRSHKKKQQQPTQQQQQPAPPPPLVPIKTYTIPKVSMKHPPEPKPVSIIESDSDEEFHEEETQEEEEESESQDEQYEVDEIMDREQRFDKQRGRTCFFYKLHFKGDDPNKFYWTSVYDCKGCKRLIANFNNRLRAHRQSRVGTWAQRINTARQRIQEKRQLVKKLEEDKEKNRNKIRAEKGAIYRLERAITTWKKMIAEKEDDQQAEKELNEPEPEPAPELSAEDKKKMLIEGMQKMQELFAQFSNLL